MSNNDNKRPESNKKKFQPKFNFYWIYLLIGLFFVVSFFFDNQTTSKKVSYSKFEDMIANNCVDKIVVFSNKKELNAEIKQHCVNDIFGKDIDTATMGKPIVEVEIPSVEDFDKMIAKYKAENIYTGEYGYEQGRNYEDILWSVLPIIFMIFIFSMMFRGMRGGGPGGIFNVGKSQAKQYDKGNSEKVTFKDVAGLEGAKQEVEEIVSFLKNPDKYRKLGGKIPKGALLVGPPGTGKTLLAKAVAGEANVPFFSMSGSDFVEMFVGVGASRVRDLFRQAKEKSPCIIFIDEIDAIGRARGKSLNHNGNDERENTLNQLLAEMDGFGTNSGVIILAATNRANILDKALLRAGRFDRQIHVELPNLNERKEIFKVHLAPIKTDDSLDIDFLARQTPGFSGAEIANVCNEAALIAARNNKEVVQKEDFLASVDRIIGGLEKKSKFITAEEKKSIAYHEAGHATISWMLEHANPLVKVTIVPRGEALGAAWYLPEERQLTTKEHILDEMCATLGGRAAEQLFFNTSSTGAINDLERVTKRAYAMVAYYGMSEKIANMSYFDSSGNEYGFSKPYSEKTAEAIDIEAKAIVKEQFDRAMSILKKYEEEHHQLAQLLIEKEVIFAEDLEKIFGERPWKSRTEEILETENSITKEE
ncbi:MAG: ATP-dependent zinc metalloprotease FtsH [Paludibacteraceae bacterium]|nr:ATP-dependent zinc metalloprotease FtsH [Paludibacteraceae bacterium]